MYKLSPSKAHRFLQCTKSLQFDTEFVETPNTIRGSLLHNFAEMMIRNEDIEKFIQENKINDYELFLVSKYVEAVFEEKRLCESEDIIVEEKRTIRLYGNNINLIMDTLLLGKDTASIIDLKTGNADVDAEDNEQLFFYAYAVTQAYPEYNKIRLSIFQKGKLKTKVVSKDEVLDFFIDKEKVFDMIKQNKLEYNPSDKACKFCAIKKTCKARARWIIGGKS